MTPLQTYLSAGAALATTIEAVAHEGELLIAPKAMVREAISRTEAALRTVTWSEADPEENIGAFRRIDGLRKLASAWLADGGDLKSEDLHDMAGVCRIVKRAARLSGSIPASQSDAMDPAQGCATLNEVRRESGDQSKFGAGNPARPQADQAGVSAPAGEGDIGPAEALPARAGERHTTAKPGKVRTHHHPRGET